MLNSDFKNKLVGKYAGYTVFNILEHWYQKKEPIINWFWNKDRDFFKGNENLIYNKKMKQD